MKYLVVYRGTLEIARAELRRPLMTVGRSPTCDLVLRAPGALPIQFLVEWIGSGKFDPMKGQWAILDISRSAMADTGEGVILSSDPVTISGFQFASIEDSFESTEVIGGRIKESLAKTGAPQVSSREDEVLELVQLRIDSGAIEEIQHRMVPRKSLKERPIESIPAFCLQWDHQKTDYLLKVLLKEMPGATIYNRGQRVSVNDQVLLTEYDVLQIRWKGTEFFLRFVPKKQAPHSRMEIVGDPLLKKILKIASVIALVFLLLVYLFTNREMPVEKPPTRIATVEVLEYVPPPPPPPVEELAPTPEDKPTQEQGAGFESEKKTTKPGKASAARFDNPEAKKPKIGLNSPGEVTNVNAIGILGALSKTTQKGPGVKADRILNDGLITQAATGNQDTKVVVRNPPAGVLGSGAGGALKKEGPGLLAAQTTLRGAGKYDPTATGPVAAKGGAGGYSLGTGVGDGEGMMHGKEIGAIDGAAFRVEGGGLDKETVKRIIAGHKSQIRTCYEKALMMASNLDGRIVYDWIIGADGKVQTVKIVSMTIQKTTLQPCVQQVIQMMEFPRASSGRSTRVIYPFQFQGRR